MIDSNIAVPMPLAITKKFNTQPIQHHSKSWEIWTPDPIDAISNAINSDGSNLASKSNIITMLVNIYGSKDLFVNEYKSLLGNENKRKILNFYAFDAILCTAFVSFFENILTLF